MENEKNTNELLRQYMTSIVNLLSAIYGQGRLGSDTAQDISDISNILSNYGEDMYTIKDMRDRLFSIENNTERIAASLEAIQKALTKE